MPAEYWALRALAVFVLVTGIAALPTPDATTVNTVNENTTLSTELRPPPKQDDNHTYILFVINLYGVKNISGETDDEMFENSLVEKVPEMLEPLATVLLVLEADDEDTDDGSPVDLDELATELEKEGFKIEKIDHGGETRVVRVKLDGQDLNSLMESSSKSKSEKLKKVRRKRTICFKCKKGGGKGGGGGYGGGGYGGGGCGGGGCGGGGGYPGGGYQTVPIIVQPTGGGVDSGFYPGGGGGGYHPGGGGGYHPGGGGGYQPGGGGGYHPGGGGGYPTGGGGGGYHPSGGGQSCNTCRGGGGGGSGAYATASAGAISWGK